MNGLEIFFSGSIFKDLSSATKMKPSKTFGFNPCSGGVCGHPAVRPLVDTGAMVFLVFGILGVNRTEHKDNHVIGDMVRINQSIKAINTKSSYVFKDCLMVSPRCFIFSKGQHYIGSKL